MKNKLFLSIFCALFLTIISCSEESDINLDKETIVQNESEELSIRANNRPGNFRITDGRMSFPNQAEYDKTTRFLSTATKTQLDRFDRSVSINTVAKEYKNWQNWFKTQSEETNYSKEAILGMWTGKVKFVPERGENNNIEYDVRPLVPAYTNIVNLDGEFQVGPTIVKQAGDAFINITDPSAVDLSSIDENTTTDPSLGVFVNQEVTSRDAPNGPDGTECISSCPRKKTETHKYQSRRRLKISYEIKNTTDAVPAAGGFTRFFPQVLVTEEGIRQRRKWVFFWGAHEDDNIYLNLDNEFNYHFDKYDAPNTPDRHIIHNEEIHREDDHDILNQDNGELEDSYTSAVRGPRLNFCLIIDHDFEDDDGDQVAYDCN